MKTMESREDYLESILILSKKKDIVRSIDVAAYLNYSKASISRAISLLRWQDMVEMDENTGALTLTALGLPSAERVYERHLLLTEYLVRLGVNRETATQDACRMEHVISEESFAKIKQSMERP